MGFKTNKHNWGGTNLYIGSLTIPYDFQPGNINQPVNWMILRRGEHHLYGGFHKWGIPKMDGLFHGKSQPKNG